MRTISLLQTYCNARLIGKYHLDDSITQLYIDSRKIKDVGEAMFIAIISNRKNGHEFIKAAYQQGIRYFLISDVHFASAFLEDACFLVVPDTVVALQQIATHIRTTCTYPVIGITGSNGKTIVKEWLYQLLKRRYHVVCNPKSYNSQIGVPLSLWQMDDSYTLGIFEAGISEPEEMAVLEAMIQPTIGIFTNIGEAHSNNFLSKSQKITEKLKLFLHVNQLVYCTDNQELSSAVQDFSNDIQKLTGRAISLFSWSFKQPATLRVTRVHKADNNTLIEAEFNGANLQIQIPFTDAAAIENAIHCWCTLLLLNVPQPLIVESMAGIKPIAMRLELKQGEHNSVIINDTYNADFTSLPIAVELLLSQRQQVAKALILSDIQQENTSKEDTYTAIARLIQQAGINVFVGIGEEMVLHQQVFEENTQGIQLHFYENTNAFLLALHTYDFGGYAILIKGARRFELERISLILDQKIHQTVMTVNLTAMQQNLEAYKRRIQPKTKIMAMVKASSYGSGSHEIAEVLQDSEVDYLTVAYVDEGVALRKAKITLPIMVMSPATQSFDRMITWSLEPEIFNLRSLKLFLAVAQKRNIKAYPIHIKLDTGMHRLGFMPEEIANLIEILQTETSLKVVSIFSHLVASDDLSLEAFTHEQARMFKVMSNQLITGLGYQPLLHLCNSNGIIQYPEYHFDMVRLGLGLYGIDGTQILANELVPIGTLKTTIAQIKSIPLGDTVGYSRKGIIERPTKIATICIGYADGYPRILSQHKGAYVLINNQPAPLLGNIAMDMCMVDITDIEGVQEGDEVIIFGDSLPIKLVADWAHTIPYEIMTSISPRVKRVYINEK